MNIRDYINQKIRQGQDVLFPTEDGHVMALTERSAYKLTDRHRGEIAKKGRQLLSDAEYALKGRVAAHIDELIQVGQFDSYKSDTNNILYITSYCIFQSQYVLYNFHKNST